MIKALSMNTYGKFFRREVPLRPFTVITGPNEAGKTTIFDALFDALCAGSRHENKPAWKRLAERYGALRRAALDWEEGSAPLSFDYAEFLEIFAIRGGDVSVNSARGGSWEAAAQSRLLNAGLDPAQLAREMTDKAETFRKDSAQAKIKKLKETIKETLEASAALKAKRDSILGGEAAIVRLEAEKQEKAAALAAKAVELRALGVSIEELAGAGRLAASLAGVKALRDLKDAEDKLAAVSSFAKNEMPAYQAMKMEQLEREKIAAAAQAALAEKQAALTAAKSAVEQLFAREQALSAQRDLAAGLSEKLGAFAAEPEVVVRTVDQKLRRIIWGAGAALAAFTAFSGGNIGAYLAAAVIAGAAAWVGLKLSVKETLTGHTPEAVTRFLTGLAEEWASVSAESFPVQDLDSARAYLAKVAADHAAAIETLDAKSGEAGDIEAGISMASRNLEELTGAAVAAKAAAESWLKARDCDSEEGYREKLAAYEKQAAAAANSRELVKIFRDRNNAANDEELREKLFTDKEELDRKGIDPKKADEAGLERLKARLHAMSEELHAMEAAVGEVDKALSTARAASGARLEGLPEGINKAEMEIEAAREEIASLELQIQAYAMAAGVFNKLAESSALAFDALGREVSYTLSALMPAAVAEFKAFDALTALVGDATGGLRQVENLSSGTRDLFMLAARLTMAKKARLGPGGLARALLVLDEPFYTLDQARTIAAVKLLAEFHAETKWQIIILTKDPAIAGIAKGIEGLAAAEVKLDEA